MIIKWFKNLFECKHEKKILLLSMPEYADPHCKLVGFRNHLKCSKCGKEIIEYTEYNNEK